MPMSTYLANKLLNHTSGNSAYTMPGTIYLALFTTPPSASAPGTEVSTSSTGYARIAITSTISSSSGGVGTNSAAIVFGPSSTAWGTITHFGIFDALTAGNMLLFGTLTATKTIGSGDKAEWPASALSITYA